MEIMKNDQQTGIAERLPWTKPELHRLEISVNTQAVQIKSLSYDDGEIPGAGGWSIPT